MPKWGKRDKKERDFRKRMKMTKSQDIKNKIDCK